MKQLEKDANQMQQYTKPPLRCQLWLPFNIKSTLEKQEIMTPAKKKTLWLGCV